MAAASAWGPGLSGYRDPAAGDRWYNTDMPKPFDATLKELIETFPDHWLAGLGVPVAGPVEVLSPDLATVTAAADALLRVGDLVVHIDAESGPDPALASRMLLYNVLAHRHTGLPVHSIVVLLRSNANAGNLSDELAYAPRPDRGSLRFRFEVVRVWEMPSEELIETGVGVLPLAVLGRPPAGVSRKQAIPGIIERVALRATDALPPDQAARVTASAMILAGMHMTRDELWEASLRLPAMIDTITFDVWEEMGGVKHLKETLLLQGRAKFGKPTKEQEDRLRAIDDLDRLKRLSVRLVRVDDWDALLRGR